ncbi:hypothetical protein D3C74_404710 [compost metagenome]
MVGIGTSNAVAASSSSAAVCTVTAIRTWQIFPRKYEVAGSGVARRRLSVPSSRSTAIEIARFWKLVSMTPVATMPGRKYCVNGTESVAFPCSCCPNTVAKIAIMMSG